MKTPKALKQTAKAIGRMTPVVGDYIKKSDALQADLRQNVAQLQRVVAALEDRNRLWEEEVRAMRGAPQSLKIVWPVTPDAILRADWRHPPQTPPFKRHDPPYTINWVVPPMNVGSGGHTDIFRVIRFLETQGHTCRIYFYDPRETTTFDQLKENLKHFFDLSAQLHYNAAEMAPADAIFATNWHTAYPVFNHAGAGKKLYFVQDFEPYFDPRGSYSTLAENTYRFGFHGITLGRWLAGKLSTEFNMSCDVLDLGVDLGEYSLINETPRRAIMFYARPTTPRRGFEIGVAALSEFHRRHPDYDIHFIGWDITPYEVPFPYINHGVLSAAALNAVYNQCAAGLVLSFTNMSLLPPELLAAGCIPVVNDEEHTHGVAFEADVEYALPAPGPLAEALDRVVTNPKALARAQAAAAAVQGYQWDHFLPNFTTVLERELGKDRG